MPCRHAFTGRRLSEAGHDHPLDKRYYYYCGVHNCRYCHSSADYSLLVSMWLSYQCDSNDGCLGSDFDQSERVDNSDLKNLANSWLAEDY